MAQQFGAFYQKNNGQNGNPTYDHGTNVNLITADRHHFGTIDPQTEPATRHLILDRMRAL